MAADEGTSTGSKVRLKVVALDIDGTIAKYDGWKGIHIIGDPLPGAVEAVNQLAEQYSVYIFTTRMNVDVNGKDKAELEGIIRRWMEKWGFSSKIDIYSGDGKPIWDILIDDRVQAHITNYAWNSRTVERIVERLEGE